MADEEVAKQTNKTNEFSGQKRSGKFRGASPTPDPNMITRDQVTQLPPTLERGALLKMREPMTTPKLSHLTEIH